ncbi:MAG: rubrerythrin family protein [Eubacteriaceae bacterium]
MSKTIKIILGVVLGILVISGCFMVFSVYNDNRVPVIENARKTYENLLIAANGETKAYTKYEAYAKVAEEEGYLQAARLFRAASDAEKIHRRLEVELATKLVPSTEAPGTVAVKPMDTLRNLEDAKKGEAYENTQMYPPFVEQAKNDNFPNASTVFTRAMKAEGVHAILFSEIIETLNDTSDEAFYLCPVCGNIEKGGSPLLCNICGAPGFTFSAY